MSVVESSCYALPHGCADGAALVYTSASANRNCGALQQYIGHRLYGTACNVAPNAVERDTVFIPAGWDSTAKIEALSTGLHTIHPDDPWEVVFRAPGLQRRARQAEQHVVAQDEQAFLQGVLLQRLHAAVGLKADMAVDECRHCGGVGERRGGRGGGHGQRSTLDPTTRTRGP